MSICKHNECNKHAHFAYVGHKRSYCAKHRLEGMIDILHKRCQYHECMKQPYFAFDGNKPVYCSKHRQEGMVNVHNKRCQYDDCTKLANFAFEGDKPSFCLTHRIDGMINVLTKRCRHNGCIITATFAFEGKKAVYCATHRLQGMIDVKTRRCNTQGCYTKASKKYKGYCLYCFIHTFPNEKIAKNYKVKENEVLNSIVEKFSSVTIVQDRRIHGGCSLRRPDVLIDLGYQVLIIETDENQHKTYDCSCENKRIMELSRDVGHRNLVFIRFNPDDYMKNGVKINSCFSRTKLGFLVIPKSKQVEWQQRLNVLHETIEYWIQNKTDKTIEVVELFFDTM